MEFSGGSDRTALQIVRCVFRLGGALVIHFRPGKSMQPPRALPGVTQPSAPLDRRIYCSCSRLSLCHIKPPELLLLAAFLLAVLVALRLERATLLSISLERLKATVDRFY